MVNQKPVQTVWQTALQMPLRYEFAWLKLKASCIKCGPCKAVLTNYVAIPIFSRSPCRNIGARHMGHKSGSSSMKSRSACSQAPSSAS